MGCYVSIYHLSYAASSMSYALIDSSFCFGFSFSPSCRPPLLLFFHSHATVTSPVSLCIFILFFNLRGHSTKSTHLPCTPSFRFFFQFIYLAFNSPILSTLHSSLLFIFIFIFSYINLRSYFLPLIDHLFFHLNLRLY